MNNQSAFKNTPQQSQKNFVWLKLIIILIILGGIVYAATYFYSQDNVQTPPVAGVTDQSVAQTQDIYIAFLDEIYDKIQTNYWNTIGDEQLSNLYKLGVEKITGQPVEVFFQDKNGVNAMTQEIMQSMDPGQKKEFAVNLAGIVLANLEPFGRGGLYSQQQEQELINRVTNVDPTTDLFKILEVDENASAEVIEESYQQKKEKLDEIIQDTAKTEEEKQAAQEKLALADRAYETLGDQQEKERYAESGVESTVDSELITPNIFYLHLKKMSPTSFEEFQQAVNAVDDQPAGLNTFILDLRGNVGGSVDLMQWFLGPFIGQNTLAYEFYHQDEYEPFKTKVGWLPSLVRYKKVVVLINGESQSSAEVMAAALKKYNVGVLVGLPTKGWGTIEKIFPLDNQIDDQQKYSIFLVHSITLREDNQPIEGRGVDPHINIENPDWRQQLAGYFNYPQLADAINNLWHQE